MSDIVKMKLICANGTLPGVWRQATTEEIDNGNLDPNVGPWFVGFVEKDSPEDTSTGAAVIPMYDRKGNAIILGFLDIEPVA